MKFAGKKVQPQVAVMLINLYRVTDIFKAFGTLAKPTEKTLLQSRIKNKKYYPEQLPS